MHRLIAASAACAAAAALPWQKHTIPISGQLVLTDVHAILSGNNVIAYASGEGGVLLKLTAPAAVQAGNWVDILDQSFPFYWYGVYSFDANTTLLSGFIDGSGSSYGVIQYTEDGGRTWSADAKVDPSVWAGGPIEFDSTGQNGWMASTSGQVGWRTASGGRNWSDWTEVTAEPGNWYEGDYLWDGNGYARLAGSNDCTSTDFGATWTCGAAVDQSGMDGGIACSNVSAIGGSGLCLIGGGEISPAVQGWVHLSTDNGQTFSGVRNFTFPFPIRSVKAVIPSSSSGAGTTPVLIAAGGNYFSGVGGIWSSVDGGQTWNEDLNVGQEFKSCRSLALPSLGVTRVFCVSASPSGGSIYSVDV